MKSPVYPNGGSDRFFLLSLLRLRGRHGTWSVLHHWVCGLECPNRLLRPRLLLCLLVLCAVHLLPFFRGSCLLSFSGRLSLVVKSNLETHGPRTGVSTSRCRWNESLSRRTSRLNGGSPYAHSYLQRVHASRELDLLFLCRSKPRAGLELLQLKVCPCSVRRSISISLLSHVLGDTGPVSLFQEKGFPRRATTSALVQICGPRTAWLKASRSTRSSL